MVKMQCVPITCHAADFTAEVQMRRNADTAAGHSSRTAVGHSSRTQQQHDADAS